MTRKVYLVLLAFLSLCWPSYAKQVGSVPMPSYPGQALTMLSDGNILATGGFDKSGKGLADAYLVDSLGSVRKLNAGLLEARGGHSATALPDGTVLIFGGTDGEIYLRSMEIFDPHTEQFTRWSGPPLVPRTLHTATLLTDGRIVIIGGVGEGGAAADDIEFWNFQTGTIEALHVGPRWQRKGHTAKLLADGTVVLAGGLDIHGQPVKQVEVYNPASQSFAAVGNQGAFEDDATHFNVNASDPLAGEQGYAIQDYVKIRLSGLADVTSVNAETFAIKTAAGITVPAAVTTAEQGRLLFLLPDTPLTPGTDYTLTLNGVMNLSSIALPATTIHFHTADDVDDGAGDDWVPDAAALAGNFGSRTGPSQWQKLAPLQAASGATALAGQALGLSGKPLAHVTLQIESASVKTDSTGRFLLKKILPGHHVLIIDGRTANTQKAAFGLFEAGVDVKAGVTNVLPYTIWMTRLDTEHAVTIASPTSATDTVISTPRLPGLELHLPAHTTIVDREGHRVTKLTITPVPLDKPPFPLPTGVKTPVYFTVQPGGSEIDVQSATAGANGARLFYPNTFKDRPGTRYDFWNYDATSKGWYIYGDGRVSPDGKSIVPDPGVVVYQLTGAMAGGHDAQPPKGSNSNNPAGDPVDLSSGQFTYSKVDLAISDLLPISLSRTYIANDHYQRAFGIGATCGYDIFMTGDNQTYQYQELIDPNGAATRFNRTSSGTGYGNAVYASTSSEGPWYGATLTWVGFGQTIIPGADWILRTRSGMLYGFPEASKADDQVHQALTGIRDRNNNQILLTRDGNALITKITSQSGRYINLARDPVGRITQATDNAGRSVSYSYDSGGRLASVTDLLGGVTSFTYDGNDLMTSITDPRNITYLTNQYDSAGRVTRQTQADGSTYIFEWTPSSNVIQQWTASSGTVNRYDPTAYEGYTGLISQVSVTDPGGYVHQVNFNNLGMKTGETLASGQPEQQTLSYQYYADNLMQSVTDALGRKTTYDYDAIGNVTDATQLAGTSSAVSSTATYDGVFSNPLSQTDPLGHTRTYNYDPQGNLTSTQDPLGHGVTLSYDPQGEPTSLVDAVGNATSFSYYGGVLTGVTDPSGAQTTFYPDALGRITQRTNPLGASTQFAFDPANRLTTVTDPQGGQTTYTYDPNDNPLTVKDALGNTTQFTYDVMDRLKSRTDPLQRVSGITYDLRGNLASFTDQKGQVTANSFDGLGRRTFMGYGAGTSSGASTYDSTLSYQYDGGSRLTEILDSLNGNISRIYDNLNRLTSETTPQGAISYTYDAAGRRSSAQMAGGTLTSYTYDNADRVNTVTQGSAQVGIAYDAANRRIALTLPNGVTTQYAYDVNSRLQSLSYAAQGTSLGSLSYIYDASGRKIEADGSLASTILPNSLTQATYDAANQLLSWGGIPASYDADGNMILDVNGNRYAWNSRNEMTGITGNLAAAFAYDALGRRVNKMIGSQATAYQYDGPNRVTEVSAGVTATLISGALDEYFMRTDSNGPVVPLTDALGSTLGLVNTSGQIATTYWYDPYGGMSTTGTGTANSTTFTGRESDGSGLLFYRARYYNPVLGRFINQDPLGFRGGDVDLYRYVVDNPLSFIDPFGLARKDPGGNDPGFPGSNPSSPGSGPGPGQPGSPTAPSNPPPCMSPQDEQKNTARIDLDAMLALANLAGGPDVSGNLANQARGQATLAGSPIVLPTSLTDGPGVYATYGNASNAYDFYKDYSQVGTNLSDIINNAAGNCTH